MKERENRLKISSGSSVVSLFSVSDWTCGVLSVCHRWLQSFTLPLEMGYWHISPERQRKTIEAAAAAQQQHHPTADSSPWLGLTWPDLTCQQDWDQSAVSEKASYTCSLKLKVTILGKCLLLYDKQISFFYSLCPEFASFLLYSFFHKLSTYQKSSHLTVCLKFHLSTS